MKILASGSAGNCYMLDDNLMIECGLPLKKIKRLNGFVLPKACVGTHEHFDHFKYFKEFLDNGINVYASAGTWASKGISEHHRAFTIRAGYEYEICDWTVSPLEAEHNANEPLAFLFEKGSDRILFATDTACLHDEPTGLTEIYIEANYSEALLEQNIATGLVPAERTEAVLGHMSFEYCMDYLCRLDLTNCRSITLLHLSSANSNRADFIKQLQQRTGVPVYEGVTL